MQKITLISATLALSLGLVGAANAQAASDNYVQFNLGAGVAGKVDLDVASGGLSASQDENLKVGVFTSALVGHDFGSGLSVEGEAYFNQNNIKSADLNALVGYDLNARVTSYGALANVKFEAPTPFDMGGLKVAPYAAAGVGYGGVKYRLGGDSDNDGGVVWQVKAGLAIHTSDQLTWDLGYRYIDTPKYKVDDGAGTSLKADATIHAVTAGVRLAF